MALAFTVQNVGRFVGWLCFIGIVGIVLTYQTILLNEFFPSGVEKLMAWVTSRIILIMAIGYGYMITRWYARLIKQSSPVLIARFALHMLVMTLTGVFMYLITGDSTFIGLVLAVMTLLAVWRLRGRWVALLVVILLLNLPIQISRWYQANRNLPLPTSEQVNQFEQKQRQYRQMRLTETQFWIDHNYAALAEYHATVWDQRLMSDLQTGRWTALIGMVLLGMIFRRWQAMLALLLQNGFVAVGGFCALTTVLELTSGRNYANTLRLYFDSLRYPGYYIFGVPDALYLTVAEASCLSMAMLVGTGLWLLSGRMSALRLPLRGKVLLRRL
ncbi:hypothetical protein DYU11_27925 [Fibrisoma montanum]|uniref:DUF418 domain-containing protein n=1 Tax=Fibrisoma montanum TaxID=2305895 RepID=A0A418LYS2_9BACT|nr:hypothetical protein [Fibrisoma montanum]RIV18409.1 hypothetical protein DYU11_27925 [Fibrisoma montanum]